MRRGHRKVSKDHEFISGLPSEGAPAPAAGRKDESRQACRHPRKPPVMCGRCVGDLNAGPGNFTCLGKSCGCNAAHGGFRCTWAAAVTPFPVMAARTAAHASNADLSGRRPRLDENPCGPDSGSTWEVVIGSHTLQVLSYALRRIWRPGRLGIAVWPGRLGLGMDSVCLLRSKLGLEG